jgi:ABC-2 type transport system permease protein
VDAAFAAPPISRDRRGRLAYILRVTRTIARIEFKLKYADSLLGYVWSIAKPLGLFGMLYIVFGRFFKLNGYAHYPIYLLLGIVIWSYYADATTLAMYSLVARGPLLTKLAFPRIVIPISVTVTAATTFLVNLVAVAVFVGASRVVPRPEWLLTIPWLVELYLFTLGVSLILATLFVRLRDLSQMWELFLQLMFYATPIIYPASFLPPWWRPVAFLSPLVQALSHIRNLIIPGAPAATPTDVYGSAWGELIPIAVCAVLLLGGWRLFRREAPWFAERV